LVLLGSSVLGNWRGYSPVVYRVYYRENNKREPKHVATRFGFLALLAVHALSANGSCGSGTKASWTLFVPLTLSTLAGLPKDANLDLKRLCEEIARDLVEGTKNDVEALQEVIKGLNISENKDKKEKGGIVEILSVSLKRNPDKESRAGNNPSKESEAEKTNITVPFSCKYEFSLIIKRCEKRAGDSEAKETASVCMDVCEIPLTINMVIIPNTGVTKTRGNPQKIVIFREDDVKEVNLEYVNRAIMAYYLYENFRDVISKDTLEDTEVKIIYDTTHGLNTIIPSFSYAADSVTPLVILLLVNKILEELLPKDKTSRGFQVSFEAYRYNSDPVPPVMGKSSSSEKERNKEYIKTTLTYNVSYYYHPLIERSTIEIGKNENLKATKVLKYMGDLLYSMSKVRAIIDEIVTAVRRTTKQQKQQKEGNDESSNDFIRTAAFLYLTKLGMIHWALHLKLDKKVNEKMENVLPRIKVAKTNNSDNKTIKFNYTSESNASSQPHLQVLGTLLHEELHDYIQGLYANVKELYRKTNDDYLEAIESKTCFALKELKFMLDDLEVKLSQAAAQPSQSAPQIDETKQENYKLKLLPDLAKLSSFFTEIVEPSARSIMLTEIKRMEEERIERILDHLIPRGLEITLKSKKSEGDEKSKERCLEEGGEALCFYPSTKVPPKGEHIRHFLAHGGFTRISKDWCVVIDTKECKVRAVCTEKALDEEVLKRLLGIYTNQKTS